MRSYFREGRQSYELIDIGGKEPIANSNVLTCEYVWSASYRVQSNPMTLHRHHSPRIPAFRKNRYRVLAVIRG
jgi:hypothetical protein